MRVIVASSEFGAGALIVGVEVPYRRDQIVFQLDANRVAVQRRERIDDSAAHAEVARLFGLRHALIAARRERFDQGLQIQPIANRNPDDRFVEHCARNRARHQRFGRRDDQRRLMPKHREQRRQLRRLRVGRRRQLRHRFYFPRANQVYPARGGVRVRGLIEEKRNLSRQRLSFQRRRRDRDDRTRQPHPHLANHQRAGRAAQSHHREPAFLISREPRFEFAGGFFQAALQLFPFRIRKFALRQCARGAHMPLA